MVDLAELEGLGGPSKKDRAFPAFNTSKVEEAISGLSTVDKAMKDAMGGSRLQDAIGQLALGSQALRGSDALAEQIRAITAPLGTSVTRRLAELGTASEALREAMSLKVGTLGIDQSLVDRLNTGPDLASYLDRPSFPEPILYEFPELPPNRRLGTCLDQISVPYTRHGNAQPSRSRPLPH
jgi:hypothetical protein